MSPLQKDREAAAKSLGNLQRYLMRYQEDLKRLVNDWQPTGHPSEQRLKRRPRLPVLVVALHIQAVGLIEKCELKLRGRKDETVARVGALLCRCAGVELKAGISTKAADLATDAKKLAEYGLLPWTQLSLD